MGEWRYSCTIPELALDGGEWSASHPGRFTPGNRDPPPHPYTLDGRMGEPQSRSGLLGENSCPYRDSTRPASSQSLY
jgi:hypothetical protein